MRREFPNARAGGICLLQQRPATLSTVSHQLLARLTIFPLLSTLHLPLSIVFIALGLFSPPLLYPAVFFRQYLVPPSLGEHRLPSASAATSRLGAATSRRAPPHVVGRRRIPAGAARGGIASGRYQAGRLIYAPHHLRKPSIFVFKTNIKIMRRRTYEF